MTDISALTAKAITTTRNHLSIVDAALASGVADDVILWFPRTELAGNPWTGNVCFAAGAPSINPDGPPLSMVDGDGEAAEYTVRRVALETERARLLDHIATLEAVT